MIELEQVGSDFWSDEHGLHVLVEVGEGRNEHGPGWYVRDEDGEAGPYESLDRALYAANVRWDEVSLAPANRLVRDMTDGDETDAGPFLVQYLAAYGPVGIDVQALANLALTRLEE